MADFSGNMPELARAMVLPALTLGLLPALALAQSSGRHGGNWLASGLDLAGNLLSQTGGILSAGIVVEYLFGVPGIGRYVMTASTARALPDLLGALGFYALVILVARLLAEACWWFAGLLNPMSPRGPDSGLSGKVYAAVALALLAVPLWLALTGTADNYRAGLQANPAQAGNKPSAEHPWGTDAGGRDVQALLLVSAGNSLRSAAGIGLAAALLSAAGVLLAGAMARKRDWRFETLSDLLLLPADVMLFCPALPALLLLWIILPANQDVNTATTMLTALVVAPRVLRAGRDVWQALPPDVSRLAGGARVLIATLPAAIFAALWLFTGIAFISSLSDAGATLTLGGILNMLLRELDLSPLVFAGLVMLVAPIVLAGADALAGRPQGDPMLRSLNM